ncbi:Beta-(1--_2)glucan export ATP-binding/permease protein NdvA [compost metagenome]
MVGLKRDYLALKEGLKYFDLAVPPSQNEPKGNFSETIFEINSYNTAGGVRLSFRIGSGKTYVISGPSGCGKTTLINSLLGLTSSYDGNIKFMGMDVSKLSSKVMLDRISVVPQNPFIFSGTIRENLLYGTEDQVDDDELMLILDALGLDFITEDGSSPLDLVVGGENRLLSGGERQRIAIARALLRKKVVMILDEPTSALDGETESRVLAFLKSRVDTLVMITHRDAPRAMADELIDFGSEAVVLA